MSAETPGWIRRLQVYVMRRRRDVLISVAAAVLGVGAGVAGLVVFAPKAWDVLLNPWIGARSDATTSRWGPRRPWMLAGGLTLPLLFVLVFAGPGAPPALAATWVAVTFLLAATAYGCFQVPYVAQPAEITTDPGERSTLMSWRVAALALGILLAGAGAPAVVELAGGGRFRLVDFNGVAHLEGQSEAPVTEENDVPSPA